MSGKCQKPIDTGGKRGYRTIRQKRRFISGEKSVVWGNDSVGYNIHPSVYYTLSRESPNGRISAFLQKAGSADSHSAVFIISPPLWWGFHQPLQTTQEFNSNRVANSKPQPRYRFARNDFERSRRRDATVRIFWANGENSYGWPNFLGLTFGRIYIFILRKIRTPLFSVSSVRERRTYDSGSMRSFNSGR